MPRKADDQLARQVTRKKDGMARRIAQVRGDRSQRQFARDLDVFQQNVNRYESGTTPHASFFIRVALREKVNLNWLILGTGPIAR